MSRFSNITLALSLSLASLGAWAADNYPGIGRQASPAEVKAWDIDVRPDFKGLPKGSGSVKKGQELFEEKCASCHGSFGESNEVFTPLVGGTTPEDIKNGRVGGFVRGDIPQRSTFTKVATISTVFDYIQRAMPWTTPKSLKPDDVYAILAYFLNLAEIVPDDFTLSDTNIAEVQKKMPNRYGMTTDHGMWPGASAKKGGIGNGGHPDVSQTPCMKGCKPEVKIGSTLPDYARTAHGELADQNRSFGPVRGTRTLGKEAEKRASQNTLLDLANKRGCMACHGVKNRIVGPGYAEVQVRYSGQPDAEARLVSKVKEGGQGTWGSIAMPPNKHVPDEDIRSLVKWILSVGN